MWASCSPRGVCRLHHSQFQAPACHNTVRQRQGHSRAGARASNASRGTSSFPLRVARTPLQSSHGRGGSPSLPCLLPHFATPLQPRRAHPSHGPSPLRSRNRSLQPLPRALNLPCITEAAPCAALAVPYAALAVPYAALAVSCAALAVPSGLRGGYGISAVEYHAEL
jgi:hypothetical protein